MPYMVKKINMNCYGDKPDWFWRLNPSGGIPVAEIDGQVMKETHRVSKCPWTCTRREGRTPHLLTSSSIF